MELVLIKWSGSRWLILVVVHVVCIWCW